MSLSSDSDGLPSCSPSHASEKSCNLSLTPLVVEVGFSEAVDLSEVRGALVGAEFQGATAQRFGTAQEVLIRLPISSTDASAEVGDRVLQSLPDAEMRRVEFVGPQVGQELTEDGFLALLYAFSGILILSLIHI